MLHQVDELDGEGVARLDELGQAEAEEACGAPCDLALGRPAQRAARPAALVQVEADQLGRDGQAARLTGGGVQLRE